MRCDMMLLFLLPCLSAAQLTLTGGKGSGDAKRPSSHLVEALGGRLRRLFAPVPGIKLPTEHDGAKVSQGMTNGKPAVTAAAQRPNRDSVSMNGFSEDYGWGQDVVRAKERKARFAEEGARIVTVGKPMNIVLEEDKLGDVYVSEVTPGGNGAIAGVQVGDRVAMVSAVFGNDMWSTQGAGLSRVQKAIQVRAGRDCKLVLQNEKEKKKAEQATKKSAKAKADEFLAQKAKRDTLLAELNEEKGQAVKSGFGLLGKKNFGLWGSED